MHERGKSDGPVVLAKPSNNTACVVAEVVEEREPAKGNTASTTHPGRSAGQGAPSGLERVREVARRTRKRGSPHCCTRSPSNVFARRIGLSAPRPRRGWTG